MKAASINHIFRLVWSDHLQGFVAVPEGTRGRGKRGGGRALTRAAGAVLAALAASQAPAAGLPTGGQIAQGTGSISQAGNTLTVNQASSKLLTNWQSFSIGAGNTVNFVQPSAGAVALNRVLGSDVSVIQGAINANGQVFLVNPNGVLFTPTAQVNVGGIVASTLDISTADFLAGNYRFSGASANAVVNQGNIVAAGDGAAGGRIALIAAKITNDGNLTAKAGNVLLGAGSDVTLDLGGPVQLRVDKGAIDALVANGGAIQADGGVVYLTAQALDTLSSAVINNTGVIRAQTLASGAKGDIRLIADMQVGTVNVGGTLDASAPQGGDGGFIETSAANVATAVDAVVKAGSASGKSGQWLLDPTDVTISTGSDSGYTNNAGTYTPNAGASTAVVNASTINAALNGDTSVTVVTTSSGGGSGDITVSAPITKSTGTGSPTLTLQADRNITVNAPITASSGKLNIDLSAANNAAGTFGGIDITANLVSHGGNILIGGAGGSLTAARTVSNGIGYALDYSASMPAVTINPGTANSVSVLSGGGNITINGYSTTTPSGNGDGAGVHLFAGSVVDSGNYANGSGSAPVAGGNINISGYALGAGQFGIKFDQNTGQSAYKTTVATSPVNGTIVLDGNNPGNSQYALGLSNAGNQGNLYFAAYSTADLLVLVNGSASVAAFQAVPPNSGCRVGYPNCGTFSVPGANGSYPDATFNAVVWSANNIYITGSVAGSKTYDGSANATGLSATGLTCSGALLNCTQSSLTTAGLWNFTTASPNAGSYSVISPTTSTYTTGSPATTYQLGYFFLSGSYQINPAPLGIAVAGNYNGSSSYFSGSSAITTTGLASTDTITGATISNQNVSANGSNFVTGLTGTTTNSTHQFLASNYVLNPTANYTLNDSTTYAGTLSGSQAPTSTTNAVWLNTAQLVGLTVSGTYNGTKTFTSGGSTVITANGLVSGDVIDSVSVDHASVAANGSNFVTALLSVHNGSGAVSTANYSFNGAANYTLSDGSTFTGTLASGVTPVVGATPGASTNAVIINRAPLGVSLTGSYSGSTTIVPTSATLTGWLGGPAPTIASATVANANVGAAGNYVTSLSDGTPTVLATSTSGSTPFVWNGSSINPNYYLSGSANSGAGTSLNALTLNPALLGIALDATYNGTTSFTTGSAATNTTAGTIGTNGGTLTVTGLQGTDTVTGVVVNDANVDAVNAGSNYVASISGANTSGTNGASTFAASNYALYSTGGAVARNVSVAGTPSAITSANNTASITPAPLGIAAAPTYNGTTSFTTTAPGVGNTTGGVSSGGTVTVAGLVNGQTLGGFTLANANVIGSNQVSGVSISGGIDPRNYVLDGSSFGAGSPVTAGTQSNAGNATNLAAVAARELGIDVLGTYNGTSSLSADGSATLTASNAVIQANGLVGGQTITGVTIASPNVAANGSNSVTGVTGGNGFDPANYALGNSQIVSGTTAFDGTQTGTPAATTNAVWLRPAPLGVAVSGTYNGSNVMMTAGGASIVASGLVGQDANASLTSATLASANVNAPGNRVTAVAGSGSFAMSNYVLDGAPNASSGLTSGAALDGSGATNSALIAQAPLGLDVLAVYNGTTQLSADGSSNLTPANAVVQANGLVGGQMITGLTISSANVSGNGSNIVTGATGTNGFDIANYRLGSGQTLADGSAFAGTQAGAGANTGAVWLKPAPLGVAVAGSYNGSNVMTTATGAVIAVSGLVGQDAGATMTSATLTSNTGGAVVAVTGSGSFDMSNYVLAGAPNPTPTLSAGSALDGSAATNQAVISPFAPPPPPSSPIVVPAFVDNAAAALASTAPTAFGGLNYVAASPLPTTVAPDATATGSAQAPAAPGPIAAADQATGAGSGLTYVSKATGAEGGKRRSASELNVNNVTVPSASGPLDVFVVNTGINLLGVQALQTLGN